MQVTSFSQPAHGTLALNADGSFTYGPATNYVGPDAFTYSATGGAGTAVNLSVAACNGEACVFAGPRLASVNSTQGALLNTLLGGLVGTNLNLTAVDWTGIAQGQISGGRLASALATELGVSSPSQALPTNATLFQVFTAAATVASADGDTADASALNGLAASVSGLNAPIHLGELLQIDPSAGSLDDSRLNALDLVTGSAELYNFRNVATTPTPVTDSGAALGLPGLIGSAQVYAQAVEPPIITCGGAGTQFHSAAIRLRVYASSSPADVITFASRVYASSSPADVITFAR